MAASSILPVEMWEMVLDNLKDPQDLLNSTHVCFLWEDILERRKPLFGFELVLPHLFPYLSKKDLLHCCQVSHSWNNTMDTFNDPLKENEIKIRRDNASFAHFSNEIEQHAPVNLTAYRNVIFSYDKLAEAFGIGDYNGYPITMTEYLVKMGHLVRHLTFNFFDPSGLRNTWLHLTPNITKLTLVVHWPLLGLDNPGYLFLPELPLLTQINYISNSIGCLIRLLQRYGAQLEHLKIGHILLWRPNVEIYVPNIGQSPADGINLTRLQTFKVDFETQDQTEAWGTLLRNQNLKLKTLHINCTCKADPNIVDAIVQVVNFQCELEEFGLVYDKLADEDIDQSFGRLENLRLPVLKAIQLWKCGLPTAEKLFSVAPLISKVDLLVNGRIDTDFTNMYEKPTVWEKLALLKSVEVGLSLDPRNASVEIRYFTREMYKYLMTEIEKDELVWCTDAV